MNLKVDDYTKTEKGIELSVYSEDDGLNISETRMIDMDDFETFIRDTQEDVYDHSCVSVIPDPDDARPIKTREWDFEVFEDQLPYKWIIELFEEFINAEL